MKAQLQRGVYSMQWTSSTSLIHPMCCMYGEGANKTEPRVATAAYITTQSISQSDYILESTSVHDPRIFMKETSGVVRNCTSKYEKKMTFTSPIMELLFRVLQNPVNVYGNSLVIAVMICLCIKWERLEFHVNVL